MHCQTVLHFRLKCQIRQTNTLCLDLQKSLATNCSYNISIDIYSYIILFLFLARLYKSSEKVTGSTPHWKWDPLFACFAGVNGTEGAEEQCLALPDEGLSEYLVQ